jgi:hypothetical protein
MKPILTHVSMVAMVVLATLALAKSTAWAGSPHFVSCSAAEAGNVLTVDGKEAGLGDEEQINVVVTATGTTRSDCRPVRTPARCSGRRGVVS